MALDVDSYRAMTRDYRTTKSDFDAFLAPHTDQELIEALKHGDFTAFAPMARLLASRVGADAYELHDACFRFAENLSFAQIIGHIPMHRRVIEEKLSSRDAEDRIRAIKLATYVPEHHALLRNHRELEQDKKVLALLEKRIAEYASCRGTAPTELIPEELRIEGGLRQLFMHFRGWIHLDKAATALGTNKARLLAIAKANAATVDEDGIVQRSEHMGFVLGPDGVRHLQVRERWSHTQALAAAGNIDALKVHLDGIEAQSSHHLELPELTWKDGSKVDDHAKNLRLKPMPQLWDRALSDASLKLMAHWWLSEKKHQKSITLPAECLLHLFDEVGLKQYAKLQTELPHSDAPGCSLRSLSATVLSGEKLRSTQLDLEHRGHILYESSPDLRVHDFDYEAVPKRWLRFGEELWAAELRLWLHNERLAQACEGVVFASRGQLIQCIGGRIDGCDFNAELKVAHPADFDDWPKELTAVPLWQSERPTYTWEDLPVLGRESAPMKASDFKTRCRALGYRLFASVARGPIDEASSPVAKLRIDNAEKRGHLVIVRAVPINDQLPAGVVSEIVRDVRMLIGLAH